MKYPRQVEACSTAYGGVKEPLMKYPRQVEACSTAYGGVEAP